MEFLVSNIRYTFKVLVFGRVAFEALFRPFSTANLRNKKTTSKFSAEKNLTRSRKWGLIFNGLQRRPKEKSYRTKIYAMTLGKNRKKRGLFP